MPGMKATMGEFERGTLHSGSKTGPTVTSRKQAIAIGLNEKRDSKKKRSASKGRSFSKGRR